MGVILRWREAPADRPSLGALKTTSARVQPQGAGPSNAVRGTVPLRARLAVRRLPHPVRLCACLACLSAPKGGGSSLNRTLMVGAMRCAVTHLVALAAAPLLV